MTTVLSYDALTLPWFIPNCDEEDFTAIALAEAPLDLKSL